MIGKIKVNDFIEIKYTGYSGDKIFDSNIEEDLKKINPEAKPEKTIIVVGKEMVLKGLDKAFEGKEIGKDYETSFGFMEGFGPRRKELVRTLSTNAFKEKEFNPKPGMVLSLDNNLVKIVSVSGGRVLVDFNNPLAGKDLKYKFKVIRKVEDEKEKVESLFKNTLKTVPEYEINDKVKIKGPKEIKPFVEGFKDIFKELVGKDLELEEVKL